MVKFVTDSSCPSIEEWMNAYDGGDIIYAATLTSALSGTYNAAMAAAAQYQSAHPEVKIRVFDTLSTGPELAKTLAGQLKEFWPQADILTYPARGLCSYYAERGGILLGAEFI